MADPYRCPDHDAPIHVLISRAGRDLLDRIYHRRRAVGMRCTRGDVVEEALLFLHHSGISDACYNRVNVERERLLARGIEMSRAQIIERCVWAQLGHIDTAEEQEGERSG